MAGEANKKVVFLFADTQIKQESFVEDISNLLNTYEVPNLLQPADLATTFENIRPRAKAAGMDGNKDQLYSFFLQEVMPSPHCSATQHCMLPLCICLSIGHWACLKYSAGCSACAPCSCSTESTLSKGLKNVLLRRQ